jgi:hypothetical protein
LSRPIIDRLHSESHQGNGIIVRPNHQRLLQHGVIPGSSHTQALGISSPGIDEARPKGALQKWRDAMEHYVGLDVSLKLTAICIIDRTGKIEREGVVASDPEAIATFIKLHAPHVVRIGLETGATSTCCGLS